MSGRCCLPLAEDSDVVDDKHTVVSVDNTGIDIGSLLISTSQVQETQYSGTKSHTLGNF